MQDLIASKRCSATHLFEWSHTVDAKSPRVCFSYEGGGSSSDCICERADSLAPSLSLHGRGNIHRVTVTKQCIHI